MCNALPEDAEGEVALPEWDDPFDSNHVNSSAWIVLNGSDEQTGGGTDRNGGGATPSASPASSSTSGSGQGGTSGSGTNGTNGTNGDVTGTGVQGALASTAAGHGIRVGPSSERRE